MAKISIIMAAYNAEKTIAVAIESVLAQTYSDYELLVVDDASCDTTAQIAESYAKQDSRVRLICLAQNGGVSNARWVAAQQANGEWIAILDSDDVWHPEKLTRQMALQAKTDADILFTGSGFLNAEGHRVRGYLSVPAEIDYGTLLKQNLISNSSALVRTALYMQHYVQDDRLHEDFALWLTLLRCGAKACGIDAPLLLYRLSSSSKSGNKLKSLCMNWRTYRYVGLSVLVSAYYMVWYAINGFKKYRNIG